MPRKAATVSGPVDLTKLKSPVEWAGMRKETEQSVLSVLGSMAKDRVETQVKTVDEVDFRGYVRRRVNYFVSGWERISAWLFIPDGKEEAPAVLCCHQEIPQGKDEPAGLEGDARMALAQHYAECGYVTLAPDCVTAGDRVSVRLDPYDTKNFYKDNPKMSWVGKMLLDHRCALDVFSELKRVDSARIGVCGHGLGAMNALVLAAFDDRIQACVASCGFTRFATDKDAQRWAPDAGAGMLPKLKKAIASGDYPFDWEHMIALAAPTATLVITSLSDAQYSNPRSCSKAMTAAGKVYKLLGAPGALDHYTHHDGHRITPETIEVADDWFERWL